MICEVPCSPRQPMNLMQGSESKYFIAPLWTPLRAQVPHVQFSTVDASVTKPVQHPVSGVSRPPVRLPL